MSRALLVFSTLVYSINYSTLLLKMTEKDTGDRLPALLGHWGKQREQTPPLTLALALTGELIKALY